MTHVFRLALSTALFSVIGCAGYDDWTELDALPFLSEIEVDYRIPIPHGEHVVCHAASKDSTRGEYTVLKIDASLQVIEAIEKEIEKQAGLGRAPSGDVTPWLPKPDADPDIRWWLPKRTHRARVYPLRLPGKESIRMKIFVLTADGDSSVIFCFTPKRFD